ncbi:uncharacterized protein J3D65DRAFT_606389 [Phyllosticta citribraziliensis]|uniref:DUF7704 domain-containing protein n=1 Tax=Phyllosticta citribraziliensis TaxID=989973 RepID=A0ABR1LCV7_9PEZI
MAPEKQAASVPLVYRVYMLWLEPVFAVIGAYLYIFTPTDALQIITPPPLHPQTLQQTPIEKLLMWEVASLYVYFAFIEFVVLRYVGSERRDIWRLVVAGILLCDMGHLWSLKLVADASGQPSALWDPRMWTRWEDWGNQFTTWFGFLLRVSFILGVGF